MYIQEKLKQLGFIKTTPIQDGVFKAIDHPKHLVGLAPTGTGKTHAYLLPILARIKRDQPSVQAVIIVPTNELVLQVHQMLKDVDQEVIAKSYHGGSNKQKEQGWLEKYQPQIVITTPERLKLYVEEMKILRVQTASYLVLDEADMMFDEAFLSMIDRLLPAMPKAKYMLFSASISEAMHPFIKKYFGTYDLIDTSKKHQLKIEYQLYQIRYQDRLEALHGILRHLNPYLCFIFVSKKENQETVYQSLEEKGYNVVSISSTLSVRKRIKIIEDINSLKYTYVVTSDLSARGLDFKISHVIHYDLPYHLEFFKHRSGRTGRMEDTGIVITLASADDHRKIDKLKKQGFSFVPYQVTQDGLVKAAVKKQVTSEAEIAAVRKIKKPTKVTPNYKKKYKEQVKKAKQNARRKSYAKNR